MKPLLSLTQDANPFMNQIHNTKKRQPIISSDYAQRVWLEGSDLKYKEEVGSVVHYKRIKLIGHLGLWGILRR